jgi:hypothetical protein
MASPAVRRFRRLALWLALDMFLIAVVLVFTAWADTSSPLHPRKVSGCYCSCAQSKTSAGCAKMCELPKYASRWWAVTCTKPRIASPSETPDAGPHFPRAPKAERASL